MGGVGGVLDTEARHDGVVWRTPEGPSEEGTHRQILPTKRALAQVDAAPSVFTTWGPLGAHIPVGEPVTFHIHARDRDGTLVETFTDAEAFTVAFDGPPGAVLRSTVTSIGGGVFQAQFTANVAGELIVTLRVLGEAVHASQTTPNPHKVHAMVLPSNLSAFFTLRREGVSYGQLDTLTAGEAAQFAVQQTTLEGLPRPAVTDGDPSFKFEITVSADEEACGGYVLADICASSPSDGSALTQTPGSFLESSKTWMYSVDGSHLRRASRYDVSVSAYDDVNDTWWPVIGSPASFVITPAPASSGSSTLGQPSGSGGLSNPAGLIVTVPVTLLDVYGNQRVPTPGELAVNFVSIPGGAIVAGSVSSDFGTQLTTASVTLTDATRTHTVEARINGELVTGSNTYTLLTVAGRAVPSASRVSGSGLLSLGRVGETRAISVHLHDSYGNPIGGDVAPAGVTVHITIRRLSVRNATSDNDGGYIDTDVVDVAASFANGEFLFLSFYFRTGKYIDGLACFVYRKIHGVLRPGYPGHLRSVRDGSRRRLVTADVRGVQVFEATDPTRKRGRGDDGDRECGCLTRRRYVYFNLRMEIGLTSCFVHRSRGSPGSQTEGRHQRDSQRRVHRHDRRHTDARVG